MKISKYLLLVGSVIICFLWIFYNDGRLEPYAVLATLFFSLLGVIENDTKIFSKFWNVHTKKGESRVKHEWSNLLSSTSNTDIFIIRGARLFDRVNGPFYLPSSDTRTNLRVLILDFPSINNEKYKELEKHYALDWKGLEFDLESYKNTIETIKNIRKNHFKGTVEVKKYSFDYISDKKMVLFDRKGFFTEYRTKSEEIHQDGYYHSVGSDSSIYLELKNFFEHVWDESVHAL